MDKKRILVITFLAVFFLASSAHATFDMSITAGYRTIDFGGMKLGEKKTLATRGNFEHQFDFNSTNGRTWYFKAQLIRPFTNGVYSIPPENFEWIIEQVINGNGVLSRNITTPGPFSMDPVLIYTSGASDNTGTTVTIKLKYKIDMPKKQPAGAYTAHIRFIMVEEL